MENKNSKIIARAASVFDTTGKLERIPKWLNLIPMITQWLWLSLRYGSVSLPSCANPHLTSGGMVGDTKQEYFECMGEQARAMTADYISLKAGNSFSLEACLEKMKRAELDFPVVAKPDLGWCGYGVCLIENPEKLDRYANLYPKNETFLLQRFIPYDGEAGIFYVRAPDEAKGYILGILLRFYPEVIGDAQHTVMDLITKDIRLHRLINNKLHQPGFDSMYIPGIGERVRLALIGSTRVGGLYKDGSQYVTSLLTDKLDAVAKDMKDFYLGRFDVRYENLNELGKGNFIIMEVNGAGSEAVHAWDPKYTIPQVYHLVFNKQRILFALAHANRQRGHKPIGIIKLAKLHFHQQKLMRLYPPSN